MIASFLGEPKLPNLFSKLWNSWNDLNRCSTISTPNFKAYLEPLGNIFAPLIPFNIIAHGSKGINPFNGSLNPCHIENDRRAIEIPFVEITWHIVVITGRRSLTGCNEIWKKIQMEIAGFSASSARLQVTITDGWWMKNEYPYIWTRKRNDTEGCYLEKKMIIHGHVTTAGLRIDVDSVLCLFKLQYPSYQLVMFESSR